jgi:hypothetical protein
MRFPVLFMTSVLVVVFPVDPRTSRPSHPVVSGGDPVLWVFVLDDSLITMLDLYQDHFD